MTQGKRHLKTTSLVKCSANILFHAKHILCEVPVRFGRKAKPQIFFTTFADKTFFPLFALHSVISIISCFDTVLCNPIPCTINDSSLQPRELPMSAQTNNW